MEKLSLLPNIGKELEQRLNIAGILTYQELLEIGSCKAFQILYTHDPSVCINMLFALEGAVQKIPWHALDRAIKDELKHYFVLLKQDEVQKS